MNQNTKEQKAFEVCKRLLDRYNLVGCFTNFELNAVVGLAKEALAPDVSKAAQRAATRYFEGPVHDTTGEAVQCLAQMVDEETKHVELREAVVALKHMCNFFGQSKLYDEVTELLEATK